MTNLRARTAVLGLLLACVFAGQGARAEVVCTPDNRPGGDWPMMGRDLGHTRTQPEERTIGRLQAATLEPAWTFAANHASGSSRTEVTGYPIVADGCVFVGASTGFQTPGWVFALNAYGGDLVWKTKLPYGIYSSLAVADGRVFAYMSHVGSASSFGGPTVVALDQRDGSILWQTVVDRQPGSDAVSSPIVFDGMVWVGVSGTAAEGDTSQRFDFRGAFALLDAATGEMLKHTWSIPDEALQRGHAGGAIWSTMSVIPERKVGFVGTGNPFSDNHEHENTNAILRIDLDRASPTFGEITGAYKGDVEEYFPLVTELAPCDPFVFVDGVDCVSPDLDLDFGAAPNVFTTRQGKVLVGAGQKSGVFHAIDPTTMQSEWKQVLGVPSAVGGIVGTAAFDGTALYAPHTLGGYLTSLDRDSGSHQWVSPTADGVHWGNPVTAANGVLYSVDLKGFLDAYDAGTGALLLHRPLGLGAATGVNPTFSWGGVSVARNTVFASVGLGLTSAGSMFPSAPAGFVIAFRPARLL